MKNQFFFFTFIFSLTLCAQKIPNGFVYLSNIDSTIKAELRYLGNHNFIGKTIDGYYDNCVIVTKETANALHKVQTILEKKGLSLKIFDAYRPQQSVNHFGKWARVLSDTLMKTEYYPKVPKSELFKRGYIASKSGHSRGSTIDLTIVNLTTGKELYMGSPYDFFGLESSHDYKNISITHKNNRKLLLDVMTNNGFSSYPKEWWHYTFIDEPFPTTYFDFTTNK